MQDSMMGLAREFAELSRDKKRIADEDKKVKARLAELDPLLQEAMAQEGVPSMKVDLDEHDVCALATTTIEELIDFDQFENVDIDAIVTRLQRRDLLAPAKPKKTVTVFIASRVWASPVVSDPNGDKASDDDYARACDALEANDFGEYAQRRFNVVSLSSAVKEMVENGQIKLEGNEGVAFDGTVRVVEKFQISARGA